MDTPRWSLVDRGMGRVLVIVPGFAFDQRIFAGLDLPFDYLLFHDAASDCSPAQVADALVASLPEQWFLMGWSLGASASLEWLSNEPSRASLQHAWLVSLRPSFPAEDIAAQRASLDGDRTSYLRDFYRRAFAGQAGHRRTFEATLLDDYLERFTADNLIEGLDALQQRSIKPEEVDSLPATLIHGRRDLIAPLAEVESFAAQCSRARLEVLSDVGHLPFMSPAFREIVLRDLES